MKTLRLVVELTYDDELTYGDDQEAIKWFYCDVLGADEGLTLFSDALEDTVGNIKVLEISDKEA